MDLRKTMLRHLHEQQTSAKEESLSPRSNDREAAKSPTPGVQSPSPPAESYRSTVPTSQSKPGPLNSPQQTDAERAAAETLQAERKRAIFILNLRAKLERRFAKSHQRRLGLKPIQHGKYDENRVAATRQFIADLQYLREMAQSPRDAEDWRKMEEARRLEDAGLLARSQAKRKADQLDVFADSRSHRRKIQPAESEGVERDTGATIGEGC